MPEPLREVRWMERGSGTWPGKIEHGCMTQSLVGGELDEVYIEASEEKARDQVDRLHVRGVEAHYVQRVIPDWSIIIDSISAPTRSSEGSSDVD